MDISGDPTHLSQFQPPTTSTFGIFSLASKSGKFACPKKISFCKLKFFLTTDLYPPSKRFHKPKPLFSLWFLQNQKMIRHQPLSLNLDEKRRLCCVMKLLRFGTRDISHCNRSCRCRERGVCVCGWVGGVCWRGWVRRQCWWCVLEFSHLRDK